MSNEGVGMDRVREVGRQSFETAGQVHIEFIDDNAAARYAREFLGRESSPLLAPRRAVTALARRETREVTGVLNPGLDNSTFDPRLKGRHEEYLARHATKFEPKR